MAANKDKTHLDLLYKPLLIKDVNPENTDVKENRVVIIYGYDTHVHECLSTRGKNSKTTVGMAYVFDLTKTIKSNKPITDTIPIKDIVKFKTNFEEIDLKQYMNQFLDASSILIGDMNSISMKLSSLSKILNTMKHISATYGPDQDKGNIIIGDEATGLAHIVYSTIDGKTAKLDPKDVEKIGIVIMDVIMSKDDLDLDNKSDLDKMRAELEYKILDAMPGRLKAGDININMNGIIDHISRMRQMLRQSSDDEIIDVTEENEDFIDDTDIITEEDEEDFIDGIEENENNEEEQ